MTMPATGHAAAITIKPLRAIRFAIGYQYERKVRKILRALDRIAIARANGLDFDLGECLGNIAKATQLSIVVENSSGVLPITQRQPSSPLKILCNIGNLLFLQWGAEGIARIVKQIPIPADKRLP